MAKKQKPTKSWHLRRLKDLSFEVYTVQVGVETVESGVLEFRTLETVLMTAPKDNKQLAAYCQQAGSSVEIEPLKITTINRLPF